MTRMITSFYEKSHDTGCLQAMMEHAAAEESWSSLWRDELAALALPTPLPAVPVRNENIMVKTGQQLPAYGVYEPQLKDGCMNYLLGGTIAPRMTETDGVYSTGRDLSVTWKLIWEDTRYTDGQIPAEESLYFPMGDRPETGGGVASASQTNPATTRCS
jgi:hypothetical protein